MTTIRELAGNFTLKVNSEAFDAFDALVERSKKNIKSLNRTLKKTDTIGGESVENLGNKIEESSKKLDKFGNTSAVAFKALDREFQGLNKNFLFLDKRLEKNDLPRYFKKSSKDARELKDDLERIDDNIIRVSSRSSFMSGAFSRTRDVLSGMSDTAAGLSLAGIGGISLMTAKAVNFGHEIQNISRQLGVTNQEFQELAYIANNESGLNPDQTRGVLESFIVRMNDSLQGEGEAVQAIEELGIGDRLTGSDGKLKGTIELLNIVSDAMKDVDAQRRVFLSDLLAEGGVEFNNVFSLGSSAMAEMKKEAKELGVIMDDSSIEKVEKFRKQWLKTEFQLSSLGNEIGLGFLPMINRMSESLSEAMRDENMGVTERVEKYLERLEDTFDVLTSSAGGLGEDIKKVVGGIGSIDELAEAGTLGLTGFLGIMKAGALLKLGLFAAGVTVLGLALQDIATYAKGGESVTGDIIKDIEELSMTDNFKELARVATQLTLRPVFDPGSIIRGDIMEQIEKDKGFIPDVPFTRYLQYEFDNPWSTDFPWEKWEKANPDLSQEVLAKRFNAIDLSKDREKLYKEAGLMLADDFAGTITKSIREAFQDSKKWVPLMGDIFVSRNPQTEEVSKSLEGYIGPTNVLSRLQALKESDPELFSSLVNSGSKSLMGRIEALSNLGEPSFDLGVFGAQEAALRASGNSYSDINTNNSSSTQSVSIQFGDIVVPSASDGEDVKEAMRSEVAAQLDRLMNGLEKLNDKEKRRY